MSTRSLGALQVAALLVSASYGIGFLFGSGELALTRGMAGGLYGVATAAGMLVLAGLAGSLWRLGRPIWDVLGEAHGPEVARAIALLSVVWMAGVLAAQIQGGVAVLQLMGLDRSVSQVLVLLLVYGAAQLHLSIAARLFAGCLLLSGVVLIVTLVRADGVAVYLQALPSFVADLPTYGPTRLVAVSLGVGLMAIGGSDYHQFLQAARDASSARRGCLLAAVLLVGLALLPPAVVVAMADALPPLAPGEHIQVVPRVLAQVAGSLGDAAEVVLLTALSTAALGSGAAILRAMASALASTLPGRRGHPVLALALGALVSARGQGIVDTMVSVNMVYLASVAVCAGAVLVGRPLSTPIAVRSLVAGFAVSAGTYGLAWSGFDFGDADLVSLLSGLLASGGVAGSTKRVPSRAS
jgi:solute:Na+ symporter, SSS family